MTDTEDRTDPPTNNSPVDSAKNSPAEESRLDSSRASPHTGSVPDPKMVADPVPGPVDAHLPGPDPTDQRARMPLPGWFLGPKAEHADLWQELLSHIFQDYVHWRRNYFPNDPVVVSRSSRRDPAHEQWTDDLLSRLDSIVNQLKAHFPFYSPRYIAHMLSEQTLPSVLGYFAGMLYNPNNVTDEAAPVTVDLELEVGRDIAEMLGYNRSRAWAHICSGGTIANLEALWIARTAQMIPFIIYDYVNTHDNARDFMVKTANGQDARIRDLGPHELVALQPNESIFMPRKLVLFLLEKKGQQHQPTIADVNSFVRDSDYNPNRRGIHAVLGRLKLTPVLFVSAAAHYSIRKAANVLGYGEDAVHAVPVTSRFRINMDALRSALYRLGPDRYAAGVIGIVGTTEEGAVDPIHRIKWLRDELCRDSNRSFWLHPLCQYE